MINTEEILRAANIMRQAAEDMNRASNNMQYSLEAHQRFMDDWLGRVEQNLDGIVE